MLRRLHTGENIYIYISPVTSGTPQNPRSKTSSKTYPGKCAERGTSNQPRPSKIQLLFARGIIGGPSGLKGGGVARIFPGSRAVVLAVVCVCVQACACPLSRPRLALSLVACACGVCGVRGVCGVTVRPLGYGLGGVYRARMWADWADVAVMVASGRVAWRRSSRGRSRQTAGRPAAGRWSRLVDDRAVAPSASL